MSPAQKLEYEKWGFHARPQKGPWILQIDHPVTHRCHLRKVVFDSEWVSLTLDGTITIHATKQSPFAWDGCSPKIVLGNGQFVVGTPDGYKDSSMEFPITWKASLIHDAFYQYLHVIPFHKKEVDKIFRDLLKQVEFDLWWVYYMAVRIRGGRGIKQKGLHGKYMKKHRPIYLENVAKAKSKELS